MPPVVVSLINLKGGVGKTTTTVQLAECLVSEFDKRVLVIDLDPQTNATISLIEEERWEELNEQGRTIFHLFNDKLEGTSRFDIHAAIQEGVSKLGLKKLSLLPSSIQLIDLQDRMGEIPVKMGYSITPMEVLKAAIHPVMDQYDYILVDCPPNLGFITRNGIEISDFFLIPTIPDTLSTYGIPQIIKSINRFSLERPLLKIRCLGLVVTKFYSRSDAHVRGLQTLPARFARIFDELGLPRAPFFETVIPLANAFADVPLYDNEPKTFREKYGRSQSAGRTLNQYVIDLTREFMEHAGR